MAGLHPFFCPLSATAAVLVACRCPVPPSLQVVAVRGAVDASTTPHTYLEPHRNLILFAACPPAPRYTCIADVLHHFACPFSAASHTSEFCGLIVLCWRSSSPHSPFPFLRIQHNNNLRVGEVTREGSAPVHQLWRRQHQGEGRCARIGSREGCSCSLVVCTAGQEREDVRTTNHTASASYRTP